MKFFKWGTLSRSSSSTSSRNSSSETAKVVWVKIKYEEEKTNFWDQTDESKTELVHRKAIHVSQQFVSISLITWSNIVQSLKSWYSWQKGLIDEFNKNVLNGGIWQSGISKSRGEYVQRPVCCVNVQSSLHENVILSVCARPANNGAAW